MRELLPACLAAAFGNHLLLRFAGRGERNWLLQGCALLSLLALAPLAPVANPTAFEFALCLAGTAIAACVGQADADAPDDGAWGRRHLHLMAATLGFLLAALAYALVARLDSRMLLPLAIALPVFVVLALAWPALHERLEQSPLPARWRALVLPPLALATLALALAGLRLAGTGA